MSNYRFSKYLSVPVVILLVISSLLFYFLAVPRLINVDKYRPEIEDKFKTRTGLSLSIKKLDSSMMLTGIKVYFTDVKVKHSDNTDFVSADKGTADISFRGLLKNQLIVREITVKSFNANVTRLENGKIDIFQVLLAKRKPGEIETKLEQTSIFADNYRILFTDQFVKPASKFLLTGRGAQISDFDPLKYIKLNAKGKIASTNKPDTAYDITFASKLPLDANNILENEPVLYGQIKDLYPEMFYSYIKQWAYIMSSVKFADAKFNINLKKSKIIPRSINADILLRSESEDVNSDRILIDSVIKDNQLNVNEISLRGNDIKILLNGSIKNFLSQNAVLNLFLNIKKLKLNKLSSLLPENLVLSRDYIIQTNNYSYNGDLIAGIKIDGNILAPNISGSIYFNNLYVSYKNFSQLINNASGKIVVNGRNIGFANVVGFINKSKINIDGYYKPVGNSKIKTVFSHLDLGYIHKFIAENPLFNKINSELKDIKSLSGFADGDLSFTGGAAGLITNGNINLKELNLAYRGISKPISKVYGLIKLADNNIFFDKFRGVMAGSLYKANGQLINNVLNATISSDKVNLSELYKVLRESQALKALKDQLSDIRNLSGYARVKINLYGRIGENIFKNAEINVIRVNVDAKRLGFPVTFLQGRIFATADRILTQSIRASIPGGIAEINGHISGLRSGRLSPNISFNLRNMDVQAINGLKRLPNLPEELKNYLNDFSDFKGKITVKAQITPNRYVIDAGFNRVYALYRPQKIPLRVRTGSVRITPEVLVFKGIHSRIARSALFLDGLVRNYRLNPNLDLTSAVNINSKDIDKYINPYLDEPIKANGKIPINTDIRGTINNLRISAEATLEKGVNLVLAKGATLPRDRERVFSISVRGNRNNVNIDNFDIVLDQTDYILNVSGAVNNINTSDVSFKNLQIINPQPMEITLLNPLIGTEEEEPFFSQGTVEADLSLNGPVSSPQIIGNVILNNDIVPSRSLHINHAKLSFTDDAYNLEDSNMLVAGSDLQIKATADKTLKLPVNIRAVEITSSSLNLDRVVNAVTKPKGTEAEEPEILPVTVQSGIVKANEFIISNFITSNLVTTFTLSPDWLLTMPDLSLEAANGRASGNIIYNVKTTSVNGNMNADGMSANAASTIFLNIPNEVYGTLRGNAQFRTIGKTKDELISNASGVATFNIRDGRLTRLGSLEYLLLAANTIRVGLAGINLNAIFNLLIPQRTGYFDVLEGTLTAEKGVLSTDNVATQGRNLSLYLSGKINMLTNYSDLTILGRVSRRVTGLLGPLGSLSINTFVEYLPGLGFIPGTGGRGLLDVIPFISRIPLLGLGEEKYRRFAVEIQGDLYDPKSVKSFRWLD